MWIETLVIVATSIAVSAFIQFNSWMWIETGHIVPFRFHVPEPFIQINNWMWIETRFISLLLLMITFIQLTSWMWIETYEVKEFEETETFHLAFKLDVD